MFRDLLKIKKLREQGAAAAVTRARQAVEAAQAAVVEAEEAVEAHEAFRVKKEAQLFAEIKGTAVTVDEIDAMKFKVGLLRETTEELKKAVEARRQEVAAAEAAVQEAEAAHLEAQKSLQKFEEFVAIQEEEERKLAVEAEEAEVEEISEAIFAGRAKGAGA